MQFFRSVEHLLAILLVVIHSHIVAVTVVRVLLVKLAETSFEHIALRVEKFGVLVQVNVSV